MSHKRIRVTPATAKVSFIEISPSKRQRRRICSLENSGRGRSVAFPSDNLELDDDIEHSDECLDVNDSEHEAPLQRSYLQRQKRASEAWTEIREQLRMTYVESSVPGIECKCTLCNLPATVMCRQCGPQVFYCAECTESQHSLVNIFHHPQLWKVCI